MDLRLSQRLRELRDEERGPGTHVPSAPLRMTLLYPSPYHVAMSSLGFLQIHRLANARPGTCCERATLPEPDTLDVHRRTRTPILTIESLRSAADAHLIGVSLAYELEMAGLVTALDLCGLEPRAKDRTASDPLIVLGGPLTFSNPLPAAPMADVVILGEAEAALQTLLDLVEARPEAARGSASARRTLLETLANEPGFYIPTLHGERLPPIGQAPDAMLPAVSHIRTPNTELSGMTLIEPERGCHRGCTFCVMRRSTNGGMRLVSPERVLAAIDPDAEKVGLVGAAVSDHPGLKTILRALVDERGLKVGISSLRADRLDEEVVGLLARGGYRSMTVALDAASERLRDTIEKNLKERHVQRATQLALEAGMNHLKIYTVINLPGETDADIDELLGFASRLSKMLPVVLAVSPFVPKFHTPLARAAFAGEKAAAATIRRMERVRSPRVQVRGPSAREAYIEYRLAQGGHAHVEAVIAAARKGAKFGAFKRALADVPERIDLSEMDELVPAPTRRRGHMARLALAT